MIIRLFHNVKSQKFKLTPSKKKLQNVSDCTKDEKKDVILMSYTKGCY